MLDFERQASNVVSRSAASRGVISLRATRSSTRCSATARVRSGDDACTRITSVQRRPSLASVMKIAVAVAVQSAVKPSRRARYSSPSSVRAGISSTAAYARAARLMNSTASSTVVGACEGGAS